MKVIAEQTVSIACDVATAYGYVANMENFGQWFPGVRSIVSNNALQTMDIGKEYLESVSMPNGKTRQIILRVKEVQLNRRFVTEGEYPPVLPRMEVSFEAAGPSTCIVNWRMVSRSDSFLGRFIWLPVMRRIIRQRSKLGVAQLKGKLESLAGQA